MWQAPGFTLASVLTFAFAIGSNSAIFSAVNAVLLRPLPVAAPEQLAVIWQTDRGGQAVVELTHRYRREWMESSSTFTHAALMGSHSWLWEPAGSRSRSMRRSHGSRWQASWLSP